MSCNLSQLHLVSKNLENILSFKMILMGKKIQVGICVNKDLKIRCHNSNLHYMVGLE